MKSEREIRAAARILAEAGERVDTENALTLSMQAGALLWVLDEGNPKATPLKNLLLRLTAINTENN